MVISDPVSIAAIAVVSAMAIGAFFLNRRTKRERKKQKAPGNNVPTRKAGSTPPAQSMDPMALALLEHTLLSVNLDVNLIQAATEMDDAARRANIGNSRYS